MTDPVTLVVAALALGVAVLIAWTASPEPPDLDGERWFKLLLATALRGAVEEAEGTAEDWDQAVLTYVLYHPAGRTPERKISDPRVDALEVPALPGEQSLVESLAEHDTWVERWHHLYDEDEEGIRARLQDPTELGPLYDPGRWVPEASWDAVADWARGDTGVREVLERRLGAHWVVFGGRSGPEVGEAVSRLTEGRYEPWDPERSLEAAVAHVVEVVEATCGALEDRVVLVGEEAAMIVILRALVQHPELRDRVVAVLSIGGVIGGRTDEEEGPFSRPVCQDWLTAWFKEDELDTEVVRLTPYVSIQYLDRQARPPGVPGLAIEDARFPELQEESPVGRMVQQVDLGLLPDHPNLPVEEVARALVAFVSLWTISQRNSM